MTRRVDSDKIEGIVGIARYPNTHVARAVSSEQTVYILHSQKCLDMETAGVRDLRACPYSQALDLGVDADEWPQDEPVRVAIEWGYLVPVEWPQTH